MISILFFSLGLPAIKILIETFPAIQIGTMWSSLGGERNGTLDHIRFFPRKHEANENLQQF